MNHNLKTGVGKMPNWSWSSLSFLSLQVTRDWHDAEFWATSSIGEEVAEAGRAIRWLQLYIYKDREVTKQLMQRADVSLKAYVVASGPHLTWATALMMCVTGWDATPTQVTMGLWSLGPLFSISVCSCLDPVPKVSPVSTWVLGGIRSSQNVGPKVWLHEIVSRNDRRSGF